MLPIGLVGLLTCFWGKVSYLGGLPSVLFARADTKLQLLEVNEDISQTGTFRDVRYFLTSTTVLALPAGTEVQILTL